MEMTWKTSLIGVPFGGGKAGICYDPAQLKPTEKEILIRAFARGVRRHIGPEIYVPAPDMGTNERDMGHIRDCISYSERHLDPRRLLRHRQAGGAGRHRRPARGHRPRRGGHHRRRLPAAEPSPAEVCAWPCRGSATSARWPPWPSPSRAPRSSPSPTSPAATFRKDGLDVARLVEHVAATGGVKGFAGGEDVPRDAVLEADCDVLIPAAGRLGDHRGERRPDSRQDHRRGRQRPADPGGRRNPQPAAACSSSPTSSATPAACSSPI